jgi:asparagine synthase (glutamine-hydrolysing)
VPRRAHCHRRRIHNRRIPGGRAPRRRGARARSDRGHVMGGPPGRFPGNGLPPPRRRTPHSAVWRMYRGSPPGRSRPAGSRRTGDVTLHNRRELASALRGRRRPGRRRTAPTVSCCYGSMPGSVRPGWPSPRGCSSSPWPTGATWCLFVITLVSGRCSTPRRAAAGWRRASLRAVRRWPALATGLNLRRRAVLPDLRLPAGPETFLRGVYRGAAGPLPNVSPAPGTVAEEAFLGAGGGTRRVEHGHERGPWRLRRHERYATLLPAELDGSGGPAAAARPKRVGVLLSGGVDSSLVTAHRGEAARTHLCTTIRSVSAGGTPRTSSPIRGSWRHTCHIAPGTASSPSGGNTGRRPRWRPRSPCSIRRFGDPLTVPEHDGSPRAVAADENAVVLNGEGGDPVLRRARRNLPMLVWEIARATTRTETARAQAYLAVPTRKCPRRFYRRLLSAAAMALSSRGDPRP